MNEEEIHKALNILHTTGYTTEIEKYVCIKVIEELKDNWNELKNWLKEIQDFHIEQRGLVDNKFDYALESEDIDVLCDVLHKIQELEGKSE